MSDKTTPTNAVNNQIGNITAEHIHIGGGDINIGSNLEPKDEVTAFVLKEKRYNDTLNVLQGIIEQNKDWDKVTIMIKKITFQVDNHRLNDAAISTTEFTAMLDSVESKKEPTALEIDECYKEVNCLATKFAKAKTPDPALALMRSLRAFVSKYCFDKSKLLKLCDLGHPMQGIAQELGEQTKKDQFNQLCHLIDDILREMNEISDIDPKLKSKHIAWLMSYYCCCCQSMGNHRKPIELYTKAIDILQSAYGNSAKNFCLYGFSHGNLAFSYENSNQLEKALDYYRKALELYKVVTDWSSEKHRIMRITSVTRNIQRVENKLNM